MILCSLRCSIGRRRGYVSRPKGCAGDDWNRCCRLQRSLLQRGEEMRADQHVVCAVALSPGMLIVVARIVVDSVTLARCLASKSWAEHALSAAAGRPSTSTTRRVAPRHHDHRRQPPTAATARLLRHARGRQGNKEASARPSGMRRRLQALVCGRLRPIASGVCGALPCLQRKRRSLPLRVLQLRPHRRDPLHPNHPNPNPHRP